jgi:hypothetical protein
MILMALRSSGVSIAVRTCCLILCGMFAQRVFARVVPNKNAEHQHSKEVFVNKSFSRRLSGKVSHTHLRGCANGANAARATRLHSMQNDSARRAGLRQKRKTMPKGMLQEPAGDLGRWEDDEQQGFYHGGR